MREQQPRQRQASPSELDLEALVHLLAKAHDLDNDRPDLDRHIHATTKDTHDGQD